MIGTRRSVAFFILLVLFMWCGFHSHEAFAATLYFDPQEHSLHRGDTLTIALRLDTNEAEGECVNTIDTVIHYDDAVRAVDISRGRSILSLWVEEPTIDEASRTVRLAGGLPGGYCGRVAGDPSLTNIIAEVVFRAPGFSVGARGTNRARIWLDDASQVLLHDGLGTRAELATRDAFIEIQDGPGSTIDDNWSERVLTDKEPPALFDITLFRDDVAFSGAYFISFNTQDKQSGIDHYEVMEEPIEHFYSFSWGRADAPWVRATSPYVLKDQTLNSTIRVKAIDKAGNETIAVLLPDPALRKLSPQHTLFMTISIAVSVLLLIVFIYFFYKRRSLLASIYD